MSRNPMRRTLIVTYRAVRRVAIAIVGASVVLVGIAMIFLPGPAVVVIPAGLGILGLEFAFARRWLRNLRQSGESAILMWRKLQTSEPDPAEREPEERGDDSARPDAR